MAKGLPRSLDELYKRVEALEGASSGGNGPDKPEIAALVPPTEDFADLTEATAAVKAIIDALQA